MLSNGGIFTLTLIAASCVIFKPTWGQVGLAYSPFVREIDNAGTSSLTVSDVKVMLKLVGDAGYHQITTYGVGVGANSGIYRENETWRQSSSVVHTAVAAAEINKDSKSLFITVYQGLFVGPGPDTSTEQLDSEINVGLEIATLANKMYNSTVQGILFPSIATVSEFANIRDKVSLVSQRTRSLGIKLGTRISDCTSFANHQNQNSHQEALKLIDFVICQSLPNINYFTSGPESFFKSVMKDFKTTNNTIQGMTRASGQVKQVMIETGWPGGDNLGQPNTDVRSMLKFWSLSKKWSEENGQQIFMHEAFNNPWKRDRSSNVFLYGEHYGRWKHTQVNDNSRNAYELKVETNRSSVSNELIFGIVFGLVLFVVLSVMIFLLYRRVKMTNIRNRLTEEEIRQFLDGVVANKVVDEDGRENTWTRMPYNREFELHKEKFTIDQTSLLGSGAFGSVFKGRIEGLVNDVAFKTTRSDCPITALRGLLSEIKILIYLGKHENIVSICGAYTAELSSGVVYVATELCSNGSLEQFLRTKKSNYKTLSEIRYVTAPSSLHPEQITDFQLIRWAFEISSAMEYISSKNVIHADLATRNVLLTLDLTAKVTDFGLSRRLYEYTEYVKKQQEPLPWRWMAVESLRNLEFSSASDVHSYGITLWEIFSLGDIPYAGLAWDVDFVSKLENGLRLQRPSRASQNIYEIMAKCWNIDPTERPSFPTLKEALLTLSLRLRNPDSGNGETAQ